MLFITLKKPITLNLINSNNFELGVRMDDKEFLASCKIPWGDQKGTTVTPEIIACLSNACEQMLPDLQKFDRIKRSLAYGEKLQH